MAIGKVGLLVGFVGCAGPIDGFRVLTVSEAAHAQSPTFVPTVIVSEGNRIPLPRGARIETDEAASIVRVGATTLTLEDHDLVEMSGNPPGKTVTERVQSHRAIGPLIAGMVVFAVAYAPVVYVASQTSSSWNKLLYVPFAGPWLDLANRPPCTPPVLPTGITLPINPCFVETITRVALVAAGALQGLGAVLSVFGLPSHSEVTGGDSGVHVSFAPNGTGVTAFGSF